MTVHSSPGQSTWLMVVRLPESNKQLAAGVDRNAEDLSRVSMSLTGIGRHAFCPVERPTRFTFPIETSRRFLLFLLGRASVFFAGSGTTSLRGRELGASR